MSESETWLFWFVYGPADTESKPKFWSTVRQKINRKQLKAPFLIRGDLNVAPFPHLDRDHHENTRDDKPDCQEFDKLLQDGLTDIWRSHNANLREWTFSRATTKLWSYNYTCDDCGQSITQHAHRCTVCEYYDLCTPCFRKNCHTAGHNFKNIFPSVEREATTDMQQSRIDLILGNTRILSTTEEARIMKQSTLSPDHSQSPSKSASPLNGTS